MDFVATKKVNDTIISLCDHIEKTMKGDSVIDQEKLPSLIVALSELVNAIQS